MSDRRRQREWRDVQHDNGPQPAASRFRSDPGQPDTSSASTEQKQGRSPAEWVSLSISITVVIGLVTVIVYLYLSGGAHESVIEVRPEVNQVRQEGGNYYLPVTIANQGGATAESVIVEVSLTNSDGEEEVSEITIDFLAGNATETATVIFSEDPRQRAVNADVLSYLNP